MRSRQAKRLQQRWLVVANNGVPEGSWKAAYKAKALRSRALPEAGNSAIGDYLFKPPTGPGCCALRQLVNCKKPHMGYFK